jgi:hypothetical protein
MAKIFYLGGGTHVRGMLRAVVTPTQLESLLTPDSLTHLGDKFPEKPDAPITLIEISPDEKTTTWPVGYSRVEATPNDFDEQQIRTDSTTGKTQWLRFTPLAEGRHAVGGVNKCE